MLRARHIAERLGLEEANMLEYNQLTRTWDKTMADYETNAQKLSSREPITLLFNYLFRLFFSPHLLSIVQVMCVIFIQLVLWIL